MCYKATVLENKLALCDVTKCTGTTVQPLPGLSPSKHVEVSTRHQFQQEAETWHLSLQNPKKQLHKAASPSPTHPPTGLPAAKKNNQKTGSKVATTTTSNRTRSQSADPRELSSEVDAGSNEPPVSTASSRNVTAEPLKQHKRV